MVEKLSLMKEIDNYESAIIELEKWNLKDELSPFTSDLILKIEITSEESKRVFIKTIEKVIERLKSTKLKEDEKLYLSEIIEKENPEFKSNNLILSPTGSGKTSFIKKKAKEYPESKCLLLVSTTSLKRKFVPQDEKKREELSNRMYSTKQKKIYGNSKENILVMTYAEFGENMRFSNKFAKQFSVIFCDEIHSLISYQSYNDSTNLFLAMRYLFSKNENQIIYHFTATCEHIENLRTLSEEIMEDVEVFNYLSHPDIKRYMPLSSYKIHGIEQVRSHLKARKESFKYFGYKMFAFCKTIEGQKRLKKICEEEGFSAQAYWSVNNEEKVMTEEQTQEMEQMIETGKLPDKYDVVIINSALQEGWDLKDERVKLAIINTTNETEYVQSLGRIRNDLDILIYKVSLDEPADFFINFPTKLLYKPIDSQLKKELAKEFDFRDKQGRNLGWPSVEKALENQGFILSNKIVNIEGKRKRVTIVVPR